MRYYPVFLDIKDKPCVVVGGGEVALRKAEGLLSAGASVTIITPRAGKKVQALAKKGALKLVKRSYEEGDLKGAFLAISATGSKEVNKAVFRDAYKAGALVNVVDDPELCSFIVPSIVDRGSLIIAISTSGKSPLLAKALREELQGHIGEEFRDFVEIIGAVRRKLLKNGANRVKKEGVMKDLVYSPIPIWLGSGEVKEINNFLKKLLNEGYTLPKLGIRLKGRKG
ncbi:MAG: bifunctional precorrin-2 dehydrogenase/sirohydrochlorin ferrochelatase [Deltaproteobacteria bacterium]|nr:bifunctional precorrin-2 dehydrogenase/sirohydrochlorin ferrochelatase [Deltaproteobacteria bacterium]